jgi:CO/xanthine dehydrogenase Mo-binding subunit
VVVAQCRVQLELLGHGQQHFAVGCDDVALTLVRLAQMSAELALDADGRFLAIRHNWVCDIGAYPSAAGGFTNTNNASLMACGAYRIPAACGRNRPAVTNTVPITA